MTTDTLTQYDAIIADVRALMVAKNADYGDSWRIMRPTSITDQIYVKVLRIRHLEDLQTRGQTAQVSEGIDSELRDILNYCAFALIQRQAERGDA